MHIKNFRNFHDADFRLRAKQVIIGENAVGKSNLIYAMQLILDQSLSDKDRMLDESDFWDGLKEPMAMGEEITIELWFEGYAGNKNVLAQLTDATVMHDGRESLKLTYKFYPSKTMGSKNEYNYLIFKGDDESRRFSYEDRKYLNIRVIKAIRDVESEMKNARISPLTQIIKQKYSVDKDTLTAISKALEEKGADTLHIGEVADIEKRIQSLLNAIAGFSNDQFDVSLRTMDIDATRLLYALRPLIDNRESGNISLGINNLLYIAMILLLIEDETIKTYLTKKLYDELIEKDENELIEACYSEIPEVHGYTLDSEAISDSRMYERLYDFMSECIPSSNGATILAVEEPEAHLHPIFQRLLYRHVMNRARASVLITTHSTHISSAAPITSIVHLLSTKENGTRVKTTAELDLPDADISDLERYIDVNRGEIYLAKGVIFVEGISEEYLIPSFARCMDMDLDRLGIVICNVNSTNFEPYMVFADSLGIPYIVVSDGDYYHIVNNERQYGDIKSASDVDGGYAGIERFLNYKGIKECINDCLEGFFFLSILAYEEGTAFEKLNYDDQFFVLQSRHIFIGRHTFEIDLFEKCVYPSDSFETVCQVFNELTSGGDKQKNNFREGMVNKEYPRCLRAIESSHNQIGKGRFAQRLSPSVTKNMIPCYISSAIECIAEMVQR
jgi:putative ATP-dependent endonuclease of OLD family